MKLVICGNGFDCHHKLRTSYDSYHSWLEINAPLVLEKFNGFPWVNKACISNKWVDVEKTLSLDVSAMINAINDYSLDTNPENVSECIVDFEDWTRFIYSFTGGEFYKWLSSIDTRQTTKDPKIEGALSDAICITFNYTDTLETVYGIEKGRILHLHGSLDEVEEENCFGNDILPSFSTVEEAECYDKPVIENDKWNSGIIRNVIQFGAPRESIDVKEEMDKKLNSEDKELKELLFEFFQCTIKSLCRNLPKINSFLSGKRIDEVMIMGHSLNGPDDLYYTECLIPKYRDKKWIIYWYNDGSQKDLCEKKVFCAKYGIKNVEYREW